MKIVSSHMAIAIILSLGAISTSFAQNAEFGSSASALQTKKGIWKRDWNTERTVRRAFDMTKGLDSSGIVVVARPHAITLDGTVPDQSQIALADSVAKNVARTTPVTNNILVRQPGN